MKSKRTNILATTLLSFGLLAGTVAVVQIKSNPSTVAYAADHKTNAIGEKRAVRALTDSQFSYTDFYLYGYINNQNVMDLNPAYQFDSQGKLNVKFINDSWIRVRKGTEVYSFQSYCGNGTPAPISIDWTETMFVPADQAFQFTLVKGQDGILTLGYGVPKYVVTVESSDNGSISESYSKDVDPDTTYTINKNKLTIGDTEIVATPNSGYKFDCWKIGDVSLTENGKISSDTSFKAYFSRIAVKDILPEDFPIVFISFPENCWVNENGVMIGNFSNISLYLHDEDDVDYLYPEDINSFVTPEGNNYSLTCEDGTVTTFVMESGELVKIIVANNPDYLKANGQYVKPLTDSNDGLYLDCGTGNMDYSVSSGVGIISMAKDNYEVAIQLYLDPSSKNIPEGTYVLSDTEEENTALLSEGIVKGAPQKSYALLRDASGAIVDCWLLKEGVVSVTVDETSMGVEITAENSNNKSITIVGTYSFVRNVEVTAGEHGSLSQAYKKDVLLDTGYSVDGNKLTIGDTEVTAVADNGYKFDSWKIADQVITTSGKITADTQFTATFVAKDSFSVTALAGEHGSVSLTEALNVEIGTAYTVDGNKIAVGGTEIIATADEGYEFDSWKIGDAVLTEGGTFTADTTFTAVFKEIPVLKVSVNRVAGGHGSVSLTEELNVEIGTAYTVSGNKIIVGEIEIVATPEEGFEFVCWKVSGEQVKENGTFTADTIFTAEFKAVEVPPVDPEPEQKGLSGGAIAGIAIGSILLLCLILYIAMFFVWKKHDKAIKFLIPSFKWINKKIFRK